MRRLFVLLAGAGALNATPRPNPGRAFSTPTTATQTNSPRHCLPPPTIGRAPVGGAVRGGRAAGPARDRLRPLRLRRGARRRAGRHARAGGQLAPPRAGRPLEAPAPARRAADGGGPARPAVRAERDRAGGERRP